MNNASKIVLHEKRNQVFWVTINRPDHGNALNQAVTDGIASGIKKAQQDPLVRVIVLTGAGKKVFCAGADLSKNAKGTPFQTDPARPGNPITDLFRLMQACKLPIVARVNGHALAGGFGLMCACDLAVAAEGAKFGTPESSIGLFPMMILPHMMRLIPQRLLLEMCITGEPWTAKQVLDAHIINYLAPTETLDSKLDWLLDRIVNKSPTAIRIGLTAYRAMQDMNLDQAMEYAQILLPTMAQTEDAREGFAAFREKRTPSWTGN